VIYAAMFNLFIGGVSLHKGIVSEDTEALFLSIANVAVGLFVLYMELQWKPSF